MMVQERYRTIEYYAVLARNKRTGVVKRLIYNFVPCNCILLRHFSDYIGGIPRDWEITKIAIIARRRIGYKDYRYEKYSALDKQD